MCHHCETLRHLESLQENMPAISTTRTCRTVVVWARTLDNKKKRALLPNRVIEVELTFSMDRGYLATRLDIASAIV